MEKKTLCVFGGSFDPLTKAHLSIIKALSKKFDTVLVVINLCFYYRKDPFMFTFAARKKIIDEVCKNHNLTNVETSDIEKNLDIDHTYYDVIRAINHKYAKEYEIYTAIGGDSYENFKTWRNWKEILDYTKLIVIPRTNVVEYTQDGDIPHILLEDNIQDTGSATDSRKSIYEKILNDLNC